jgi:hypothetical protein
MDTAIVAVIIGLAVIYLVKRYLRIFRPQAGNACDGGCSGCSQESVCRAESKTIQAKPCVENHRVRR